MTAEIPLNEPAFIQAGLNIKWKINEPDYTPADGWQMIYYLVKDGAQVVIDSSDNGDGCHLVSKTAAQTATYTADGDYFATLVAIKSTDKFIIRQRNIKILKNFITATDGFDTRSEVKKTLDILELSIQGLASQTAEETTINGKMIKRYTLEEKIKAKKQYLAWYEEEQALIRIQNGEPSNKTIFVEFV